ncbi:MAG: NAD(P)-dependent alcohol dehydrogenase [Acidimicrobiia bacterium]
MKAIIRHSYGSPDDLELKDVDEPEVTGDEVLVRVVASGVNMADVDYLRGHPRIGRLGTGLGTPRNTRLGLDLAGYVEAVGPRVTRFEPGDEVFGDLTNHGYGAFAEYACASEKAFAPKPTNLTFEEAAVMPQSGVMAVEGLRGKNPIEQGDEVLINGAGGGIGPFAVQIAKSFGAEVTGVDSARKLDLVRSVGADHVIDYSREVFAKSGHRYDWILDIATTRSIFAMRRVLKPDGTYLSIPDSVGKAFQAFVMGPLISLAGSRTLGMSPWKPFNPQDVATLTRFIESGELKPVIDKRYPLTEVAEALQYQESGEARGKLVIIV